MTSEKKGRTTKSDRPLPELKKERDAFLQSFFRKGVQLTEELIGENVRMRHRMSELESENATLRTQLASDDAIRELLKKIEALEVEKGQLLSRFQEAQAASSRYVDQFAEIESELANLANLYIASFQLHGSLSLRSTIRQIKELLEQLVGARSVAVYWANEAGDSLFPIAAFGLGAAQLAPVDVSQGLLGEVFTTGVPRIEKGSLDGGSFEAPAALVPMKFEDKVVGVLAVFSTFEQKPTFLQVDFELFKLLGAHAGRALVCARLFSEAGRKVPDLEGFLGLDF